MDTAEQVCSLAERAEAEFMARSAADNPGVSMIRVGTGVAIATENDASLFWTRSFGFTDRLTRADVGAILDFYQAQRVPTAMLQFAPWVLPPDWPEICAVHGLTADTTWVKLGCEMASVVPKGDTDLPITEVSQAQAAKWAAVIRQGFGIPRRLTRALTVPVSRPGMRHFVAWDGNEPVGAACLFVDGEVGYLTTAATLPSHRNRGIQSAMISRRAKEAAAAGCRMLVAETGKPFEHGTNSSLNNLTRAGMQPLYPRRNWLWRR